MKLVQHLSIALFFTAGLSLSGQEPAPIKTIHGKPIAQAHAHNDYEHDRPLLDALAAGFCSVEADIYLIDGHLLVAHDRDKVNPERTLQRLYLEPLKTVAARQKDASVYPGEDAPRFYLLIDLKSEAESTYAALNDVLSDYKNLLTEFGQDGRIQYRAVTVIISGNRPKETMAKQVVRHAGFDGRLSDLGKGDSPSLVPWISDNYGQHFKWRGDGAMPEEEIAKLQSLVAQTHAEGKLLRLWATPDVPAMWDALREAGVDWINSDRLGELSAHLGKPEAATRK
ncbi:MAG: phosphatidylinositol-specific phospholipase C/glycerophosphodiester phosphodiesterase family protein [Verrucomicrobia bacterium]|nr:phosphatidylinositol-specific phospholipase C/glycerophosphodiester phosphodiesterase family protein [Verrucomicrobiota bacterium]